MSNTSNARLTAEETKERMTIPQLAAELFPGWIPGKRCRSPFREDKNPSFSVYGDGRCYNDFGNGDHGDVIDFYARAKGLTNAEAIRELGERLSGAAVVAPVIRAPVARPVAAEVVPEELTRTQLQRMAEAAHRLAADPTLYRNVLGDRPEWTLSG